MLDVSETFLEEFNKNKFVGAVLIDLKLLILSKCSIYLNNVESELLHEDVYGACASGFCVC